MATLHGQCAGFDGYIGWVTLKSVHVYQTPYGDASWLQSLESVCMFRGHTVSDDTLTVMSVLFVLVNSTCPVLPAYLLYTTLCFTSADTDGSGVFALHNTMVHLRWYGCFRRICSTQHYGPPPLIRIVPAYLLYMTWWLTTADTDSSSLLLYTYATHTLHIRYI